MGGWLIAVLAGAAAGVLSGFGIGGGTLLLVYLTAVAGLDQSPEALARDLEQVDVARVVQAAQALSLDTVYFLKGMEG